jgi:hypothetical protein
MRNAHAKRAYLVPDGHGQSRTCLDPHPSRFGLRLGNWHDGAVCASREAAVKPRQIITYLAIAFVIWWVIQEPADAGHLVHNIGSLLSQAAHGMSNFVASI